MNEIYWITRMDGIKDLFIGISAMSFVIGTVFSLAWIIIDDIEEEVHKVIGWIAICAISLILPSIIIVVLTPTTEEALAIYGIGGTIDYIKDNEKAKQLPDKVIDALDKYLDSINEDKK